jgi:hypothetical protein
MSLAYLRLSPLLLPIALLGCGADDTESCQGKCDDLNPGGECTDARYADGSCDLDLDCAAPDLDCFVTFEDDAEATEWFAKFEEVLAGEELREPRALLSSDDPRYARMRELLDRGWESYTAAIPVADLADFRPGLVIVEDPSVNAFVAPDLDLERAGLAVMVQTGTLDLGGTDDALLGLIMHELEHAVGIHFHPEVKARTTRYYQVAPGEAEPFGFEQASDPDIGEAIELLIATGREVGLQPHAELNGMPLFTGMFFTTLQLAQQSGTEKDPVACEDAGAGFDLTIELLVSHFRSLDGSLDLGAEGADLEYITGEYFDTLKNDCLADSTATLFDVLAFQLGATPEQIRAQTTPEDLALVDGEHVIDALRLVTLDRYDRINAVEDVLASETGAGIDSLRYFTTEEAADDRTVEVLRGAGLEADGLASFFLDALMSPEDRAECLAIVEAGEVPPYGVDLADDHHATCWRVWHVQELAAAGGYRTGAARRAASSPTLGAELRQLDYQPFPRPHRYGDYIPDCLAH